MYIFMAVNVYLEVRGLVLGRGSHSGVPGNVLQSWYPFKWLYPSWVLFYSDLFGWSFPAMTKPKKETMTTRSRILSSPNCCLWITGYQTDRALGGLPFLQLVRAFYLDCCLLGQWRHWETEKKIHCVEEHWREELAEFGSTTTERDLRRG